jgi:hypothetical protein
MIRNHGRYRALGIFCGAAFFVTAAPAGAATGSWTGGIDAGVTTRTAVGDVFTIGVHAEREMTPLLSVGPAAWVAPGGEESAWGLAGHARLRWDLGDLGYPPFTILGHTGLGFLALHADRRDAVPEDDDSGVYVPIGLGVQYAVVSRVALSGLLELRVHSLEVQAMEDQASMAFLFGLQWLP